MQNVTYQVSALSYNLFTYLFSDRCMQRSVQLDFKINKSQENVESFLGQWLFVEESALRQQWKHCRLSKMDSGESVADFYATARRLET